ncbi:MAG: DUF1501 domain-containing protein [Gemmataceae bacterium]|nr:DUF1501 domain-containing protein [Gemmataceae bacterium]
MFHLETNSAANFGRPTRREWMRLGFLGIGGLTLGDMLRARAQESAKPKDTAVILLFAHGGPSHLETYDMKPDAPDDIRGPFKPIKTNVPGIEVCEHLPKHAKIADRFSLIRSVTHDEADHFAGHRRFLSGYGKLKSGTGYESHYPQVGAIVNRLRPASKPGMPTALAVNGVVVNGPDYAAGISEGYWPSLHRVPIVNGGIRDSVPIVDGRRLGDRLTLRRDFDKMRHSLDATGTMDTMDGFGRQALEMMSSGEVHKAFDLSREDPKTRDKFGEGEGQEVLTARRLVEAGVSFVTVCARGSGPGSKAHNWDDHAVNWDMQGAMLARMPRYDHVVSTLINDLYERGLDQKVLLIVTGEFGRTPRLEKKDGIIGRDHWPSAMSILISGGGMPMGQVIGSTTSTGERPKDRPLDPHDLLATIFHHLGINPHTEVNDQSGRPFPICRGEPIQELV